MSIKVKFTVLGTENNFTPQKAGEILDSILARAEENFTNGKATDEAHEDLKWMMRQGERYGITFDMCCEALNKDPEEERMRLLTLYMQKHGNDCLKKGH